MNTLLCPNCKLPNAAAATHCVQCGTPLIATGRPVPPPLPSFALPASSGYVPPPVAVPMNFCRVCGQSYGPRNICPRCQAPAGTIANPNDPFCATYLHIGYPYPAPPRSDTNPVPLPADPTAGWNWGAFLLAPLWAAAHNIWWALGVSLALLLAPMLLAAGGAAGQDATVSSLVPLLSFCYAGFLLVLGARGNALAWKRRSFESAAQFFQVQRRWREAGFAFLAFVLLMLYLLSR